MVERDNQVWLRVAFWPASQGMTPRGGVFLCHGFTEFIEKYYEVIERLRSRGYAVVTFDWRGQGLSSRLTDDPMKGHVERYSDFIDDALDVYQRFRSRLPTPYLLVAHSMGGHLSVRMMQEQPGLFDRAVLSAPMLGWNFPVPLAAIRGLAWVMTRIGFAKRFIPGASAPDMEKSPDNLTSDAIRLARNRDFWRRNPDLKLGGPTWRWLYEALVSVELIMRDDRVSRLTTPTLVLSATLDTVVSPLMHHRLGSMNPCCTVLDVIDAQHEIFQENDRIQQIAWQAIDQFLENGTR